MPNTLLDNALNGVQLNKADIDLIFEKMLNGTMHQAEIAAYLAAWRCFPVYANLLAGGARFLRQHAVKPAINPSLRPIFDNCGTGGSGQRKFNTSTTAAIVAASCGVRMAKHGNRSISGRCGSADLLSELGFPLDLSEAKLAQLFETTGFTFFFAPQFHPLMRHVSEVRKALEVRSIFNLLGPLANPIAPDGQLVGVASPDLLEPMATALKELGVKKALVVHSSSGLDEISAEHKSSAIEVSEKGLSALTIDPVESGVGAKEELLNDGTPQECATIFHDILNGVTSAYSEGVAINAAYLLYLAGKCDSAKTGITLVKQNLSNGQTKAFFERWLKMARA